jgi:tetratricopeptide (TPR) repeat protein
MTVKNLFSQIFGCVALVVFGGLLLSLELRAQQEAAAQPLKNELSQKVADGMQKLKEATDANDTPKSLAILDELLKVAEPGDSFDRAQLNLYKGNLSLQLQDTRVAIEPLETVFDIISRLPGRLPAQDVTQAHKNLAIVYFVAIDAPNQTAADRARLLDKAIMHYEAYIKGVPRKSLDDMYQYANFLYRKATMDREDDKVDVALVRQARQVATDALPLSINFPTALYRFIMAMYQYEGDNENSARVAELLLNKEPKSPDNARLWTMLPGLYLSMANVVAEKGDKQKANEYRYRAIIAYDRAMNEAGLFKGEKGDDPTSHVLNLAKTYFDIGQIEKGAEVMLQALRSNHIQASMTERVWGFVATYYQQLGKQDQAISVLKEAATKYPQNGQFDLQVAQAYFSLDRVPAAIDAAKEAARKGVPGREVTLYLSLAYYCYSADRYEEAVDACKKGLATPDVKTNAQATSQFQQILKASEDSIKVRDQKRANIN